MIRLHPRRSSSNLRTLAILAVLIATLYVAREILIPLAFAVTLALILSPVVARLVKMHIGRAFAALIVVVISIGAAGGGGLFIFNQFIQVLNELPVYQENIQNKIQAMRAPAKGALGQATENVRELGKELSNPQTPSVAPPPNNRGTRRNAQPDPGRPLPVQVVAEPASELQYLRDLSRPFLPPVGMLGIVLIFTLFLLIERDDIRDRLFRLAGLSRMNLMTQALEDATRRVSRYLMLQCLVNACFGMLCGIGLNLIGVPYAALWGAVATIFRIVPYVGSTIAGLFPLLLSLAVFDRWTPPLLVFFVVCNSGTSDGQSH
jgi:predicted PurR-regulated permease PerM